MSAGNNPRVYTIFFHPDYTVGFGVSPNHALRLVGFTTGGESHPALKIFIQLRLVYTWRGTLSIPVFAPKEIQRKSAFLGGYIARYVKF